MMSEPVLKWLGVGAKGFIYRDKANVAKCIQMINSDRVYED